MSVLAALAAGEARAQAIGARVVIAVVEAGGALAGFVRMPGAFLVSPDLAIDKAWSAAGFGMTTRALAAMLASESPEVRDGLRARARVTVVPGGVPIAAGGGIGVSGGSAEQDEEIAAAALAALA